MCMHRKRVLKTKLSICRSFLDLLSRCFRDMVTNINVADKFYLSLLRQNMIMDRGEEEARKQEQPSCN